MKLLVSTDVPSYSSFIRLPDTSDTSLWHNAESNHILTALSTTSMIQTKQSTTDNTYRFLNGVQDRLGTIYQSGNGHGELEKPSFEAGLPMALFFVRHPFWLQIETEAQQDKFWGKRHQLYLDLGDIIAAIRSE
jgi:hypothetical protein